MAADGRSSSSDRLETGIERDIGLDHLAGCLVRHADDAGLGHRLVLDQGAFHLERPDQVAGDLIRSSARPTNQK
jgi:hypothetical protein